MPVLKLSGSCTLLLETSTRLGSAPTETGPSNDFTAPTIAHALPKMDGASFHLIYAITLNNNKAVESFSDHLDTMLTQVPYCKK